LVPLSPTLLEIGASPQRLGSTAGHPGVMPIHPEITQRDSSKEIVDAFKHGQSFTITQDDHWIGELTPPCHPRRFVPRQEFATMSCTAPCVDIERFRADQDAVVVHEAGTLYYW
jgi:hypothetical protein